MFWKSEENQRSMVDSTTASMPEVCTVEIRSFHMDNASWGVRLEVSHSVNERNLLGCIRIAVCPIIPPRDKPTKWNSSIARVSSNSNRSFASNSNV